MQVIGAAPPIGYRSAMTTVSSSRALPVVAVLALGVAALWLRWSGREPALTDRTRQRLR